MLHQIIMNAVFVVGCYVFGCRPTSFAVLDGLCGSWMFGSFFLCSSNWIGYLGLLYSLYAQSCNQRVCARFLLAIDDIWTVPQVNSKQWESDLKCRVQYTTLNRINFGSWKRSLFVMSNRTLNSHLRTAVLEPRTCDSTSHSICECFHSKCQQFAAFFFLRAFDERKQIQSSEIPHFLCSKTNFIFMSLQFIAPYK